MRHQERRLHLLEKLGLHLRGQRQAVFCETPDQFALRFERFGYDGASAALVVAMETGQPEVNMDAWMAAWQIMQVADAVVTASKSDAALFLAAARSAPGIEEEMLTELNKSNGGLHAQ